MAFEPNFEKVVASVRKRLGEIQSQVDCKLSVTDDVKKIICSNAKANIVSVETNGKDIIYSGFVNFQVVYFDNDMNPVGVDYTAEFRERYSTSMELSNVVPIVNVSVVDVNTSVNGDIKAVAIIETVIDVIINSSTTVLTNINGDTYFTKKELLNYTNYVSTISNKFELNNDVEIKDAVSKILSVCPSVFIDKINLSDDLLVVNGGCYFDISYLGDDNVVRTMQYSTTFTQEIESNDVDENCVVQSCLQILYNDIRVTTSIDTDSAIVNVELPVMYSGYVFKNESIEVVNDLYSTTNYVNVVAESIESLENSENIIFDEKLNGSVSIQENDAFIDEILGNCCGNVVVANKFVKDGLLTIEGIVTTTILYLNKENNSTHSVEVEMPFSTTSSTNQKEDMLAETQIALTQISARARRGKEIEVSAVLQIYSDIYNNVENAVITKVEEDEEIPESDCAMTFYISKDGDTIWSIARELKISTDLLLAQNPNLADDIAAGTKLVVYRQRQVEF